MIPDPLHPAVVHFPLVLVFLVPVLALVFLWSLRRGASPRQWGWVVVAAAALSLSAWAALRTGGDQEERVEEVVAESAIHTHEEAAETFLVLSLVSLVVLGAGLAPGRVGKAGRYAGTAGALLLILAGWRVGASGGDLVYKYGAGQAYADEGLAADRMITADGTEGADRTRSADGGRATYRTGGSDRTGMGEPDRHGGEHEEGREER